MWGFRGLAVTSRGVSSGKRSWRTWPLSCLCVTDPGQPSPALGPSVKICGPHRAGGCRKRRPGAPQRGNSAALSVDSQPEAVGGRAAAPEAGGAGAAAEGGRPGPPAEPLCPAGGAAAPQPAAGLHGPAQRPEGGPAGPAEPRQPAVRPHLGDHSDHFRGEGAAGHSVLSAECVRVRHPRPTWGS